MHVARRWLYLLEPELAVSEVGVAHEVVASRENVA